MKSASLLAAVAAVLLPASMASPAINAVEWTAQQVVRFGEADIPSSNGRVHAASGWQFIDCGTCACASGQLGLVTID